MSQLGVQIENILLCPLAELFYTHTQLLPQFFLVARHIGLVV